MFNSLNPLSFVTKREDRGREPEPDAVNRDLDELSANASADRRDANSDKQPLNDSHAAELPYDQSEAFCDKPHYQKSVESLLAAKLGEARRQIQQQAAQIADIQTETAKQAQVYKAKIARLEGWYSTELHRMEQKLRRYVNDQIATVHSAYSIDGVNAPSQTASPRTIQTTYVVPDRSKVSGGSRSNKVPLFLLWLAVGLAIAHLLAAVAVTYTNSPRVLTVLSETMVQQLLPMIAAIIGISGAIAFLWELRR